MEAIKNFSFSNTFSPLLYEFSHERIIFQSKQNKSCLHTYFSFIFPYWTLHLHQNWYIGSIRLESFRGKSCGKDMGQKCLKTKGFLPLRGSVWLRRERRASPDESLSVLGSSFSPSTLCPSTWKGLSWPWYWGDPCKVAGIDLVVKKEVGFCFSVYTDLCSSF